MADNFDGSIRIDTSVDTSGFKKGAKEVEQGTQQLVDDVNKAGKDAGAGLQIDTTQAQDQLNQLKSTMADVKPAILAFYQAMDGFAFGGKNNPEILPISEVEAGYQQSEEAIARMQEVLQQFQEAADPANTEHNFAFEELVGNINACSAALGIAKLRLEEFKAEQVGEITVETDVDTEGFQKGSDRLKAAIESFRGTFGRVEQTIRESFNGMFEVPQEEGEKTKLELEQAALDIQKAFRAMTKEKSIPELYRQLEQLRFLLAEMGRKTYTIDGVQVSGVDTKEFAQVQADLMRYQNMLDNFRKTSADATAGINAARSQAVERFNAMADQFDLSEFKEQADILDSLKQQYASFAASFAESDEAEAMKEKIHDLSIELKKSQKEFERTRQEAEKPPYMQGWDAAMENIKNFPTLSWQIKSAMTDALRTVAQVAGGAMAQVGAAINNPSAALDRFLGMISLKARDAASGLAALSAGVIKAGLQGIAVAAERAASALVNMAKGAVIGAFNKLKAGVGKVRDALTGVSKKATNFNGSLKGGFTTVLKYAFGIRSLYFAFRKLRSAVMEGFANVLKYDTELKATVDDFKLSVTNLKNAVGAAVAPLAQMVLPVLTRIIDAMTEAVNHAGMLVAALTGAKSYTRATKAQAKAYEDEQKAAKEAQKTIAGFDDLTILQENDADDNANQQQNPGFETVPIEEGIAGIADALKDMWDKADFTELGAMLGARLRDALNSIPWDEIKAMCRKIGKSIATFLNGFFETPGLFDAIGRTIAQALNSIFEFLNAFVTNLHWDSIGNAIRDGLLGFLDNIDWALIQDTFFKLGEGIATALGQIVSDPELPTKIGQAVANVINTGWLLALGFVSKFPWGNLGTAIKNGVLGGLRRIDWATIYETMAKAGKGIGTALENALDDRALWSEIFIAISNQITALFTGLYNFVTTPDWGSIGKNIGLGLNDGVANFPWGLVADTLVAAVNGAIDLLFNFVANFDFYALGENIGTLISDTIGGIDWNRFGATIAVAVSGLFDFFSGLFDGINWEQLGESVIDFIAGFFGNFRWESVGHFISSLVTGLFDFLTGIFKKIKWEDLPTQVIETIKRIFNGVKWDKVLSKLFTLLGTAFISGIKLLVGVGGAIVKAGGMVIEGFLKGITGVFSSIGSWIKKNIFDKFTEKINSIFDMGSPSKAMEPFGANVILGFLQGILAKLANLPAWLAEHVKNPFVDGIATLFGIGGEPALKSSGAETAEGFKTGMDGVMGTVGGWINSHIVDPVKNGISGGFGTGGSGTPVTTQDGSQLVGGLKTGMEQGAGGMENWVSSNVADPILSGVESPLGISNGSSSAFNSYGDAMMASMRGGMEYQREYALQTARGIAEALGEAFQSFDWTSVGTYLMTALDYGLTNSWDWIYREVTDIARSLLDAACNALGIASPSKEFIWVAEMITKGLTGGLKDTSGDAIQTMASIADQITEEAQNASPEIPVEAALDGSLAQLDATMAGFSDRIIAGFERMISSLQAIATNAGLAIPMAAMGAITPYASRVASAGKNAAPDMETIMELIAAQNADKLTREDLREILEAVAREYFNFDFYLGDEQVARSANRGQERLERRYRPVRA